jgi:hypothetical protein
LRLQEFLLRLLQARLKFSLLPAVAAVVWTWEAVAVAVASSATPEYQ